MTVLEPFAARLSRGTVIADGAWGTMLFERGLPPGRAPEWWTAERPDVIRAVAAEYLDAGAEIITTNTFGGSRFRLGPNGLAGRVDEVNRCGVELVREAAAGRAYVSASIGPSGLLLKPYGDADPDLIRDGFEEQITALAAAGADVFCVETMTDVREAVLAVTAVRRLVADATVIATMTFDVTPRGPFTVMGTSVAQAAAALEDAGADLVGANCGTGVESMREVARAFRTVTRRPLAMRANAGLPQRRGGRLVYPDSPSAYAAAAAGMAREGVAVVGGCCGTTPQHIAALRRQLSLA